MALSGARPYAAGAAPPANVAGLYRQSSRSSRDGSGARAGGTTPRTLTPRGPVTRRPPASPTPLSARRGPYAAPPPRRRAPSASTSSAPRSARGAAGAQGAGELAGALRARADEVRRLEHALVSAAEQMEERAERLAESQRRADELQVSLNDEKAKLGTLESDLAAERKRREEAEQKAARLESELTVLRDVPTPGDEKPPRTTSDSRVSFGLPPSGCMSASGVYEGRTNSNQLTDENHGPTAPLIGFCNPLLDMSLRVDAAFLDKWGLQANDATLASEQNVGVFAEMAGRDGIQYIPGGSGLNTLRVAQWILGDPGSSVFIGTTGTDDFGERLHDVTRQEGVVFPRCTVGDQPTGTCAVLLTGDHRSLVANLGASAVFESRWLQEHARLSKPVARAGMYYITGFFLRTSPDTCRDVAQLAARRGREVALNLSAPFVIGGHADLFREYLPSVDILFGNDEEAKALAQAWEWEEEDACDIARRLQQIPRSDPALPSRTVVITQGAGPVIIAAGGHVDKYDTPVLEKESIVDTNGAGDAFVGGFLASRMKGRARGVPDIAKCVKTGQWTAAVVIGRPGCSLPDVPPGVLEEEEEYGAAEPVRVDTGEEQRRRAELRFVGRRPTVAGGSLKCEKKHWKMIKNAVLGAGLLKRLVKPGSGQLSAAQAVATKPVAQPAAEGGHADPAEM